MVLKPNGIALAFLTFSPRIHPGTFSKSNEDFSRLRRESPLFDRTLSGAKERRESVMSEPEVSFGNGRNQIKLKGSEAIRAGGWSIRVLLLARAAAIFVPVIVAAVVLVLWRFGILLH